MEYQLTILVVLIIISYVMYKNNGVIIHIQITKDHIGTALFLAVGTLLIAIFFGVPEGQSLLDCFIFAYIVPLVLLILCTITKN